MLNTSDTTVPQGSMISVALFGLEIKSIIKAISPGVECSLYMDLLLDLLHIHITERLQQCLSKLSHWA